jgi:hypothetical protein
MSGMVFGPIPNANEVVAAIAELEQRLNEGHRSAKPEVMPA